MRVAYKHQTANSHLLFILVITYTAHSDSRADDFDAKDVLNKTIDCQKSMTHSSHTLEVRYFIDSALKRSKIQESRMTICRDDRRFDIQGDHKYIDADSQLSYHFRSTSNNNYAILYQYPLTKGSPKNGYVAKQKIDDYIDRFLGNPAYGGCLDGYLVSMGGKSLAENLLTSSTCKVRGSETIDGIACIVVEGHSKFGQITMWVCPSKGYSCLKFVINKTDNDIWGDKPINQLPLYSPSGKAEDRRKISRCTDILQDVVIQLIEGKHVPTAGRFTETVYREQGTTVIDNYNFSRKDVKLNLNNDRSSVFDTDLPIDTPVTFEDDSTSGVAYKWNGKDIAVHFGDVQSKKDPFAQGRSRIGQLIAINTIIIAFFGAWIYYRRKHRSTLIGGD